MRSQTPLRSTLFLLLGLLVSSSRADDDWKCSASAGGKTYDLSSLAGDKWVYRDRETPPTKMVDKLFINLCAPLKEVSDGADGDKARISAFT